jgi:hypothetical protein
MECAAEPAMLSSAIERGAMNDPNPEEVTLNTLREVRKDSLAGQHSSLADLDAELQAVLQNVWDRESIQAINRLLREAIRILQTVPTPLDVQIREQRIELQKILCDIADGMRGLQES